MYMFWRHSIIMYKLIKNGCISCGKSKRRFGSGLYFFCVCVVIIFLPEVYGCVLFVKVSKQYVCEIFYWWCSFVDGTRIMSVKIMRKWLVHVLGPSPKHVQVDLSVKDVSQNHAKNDLYMFWDHLQNMYKLIKNGYNSLILFFVLNCELMDSNSVVIDLCENAEHFVFMYVGIGLSC